MTLGTLFTADFLTEGLQGAPAWNGAQAPDAAAVEARFRAILAAARDPSKLNEAQTEERIFRPMLRALGWEGLFSVQENMETRGRINVPDYSYFLDRDAFASGDAARTPETKFPHAIAVGDAKAWNVDFERAKIGEMDTELFEEFFRALAFNAMVTLHITKRAGRNAHHVAEACFKATARALRMATELDKRIGDAIPSTKGAL